MEKAIVELWNGRLDPGLHLGEKKPELEKLYDLMQRNYDSMKKLRHEELADLLEKYRDCVDEYITLTNEQAFVDGFCLGTKMVVEALTGAENML